jgi:hypothetical protein
LLNIVLHEFLKFSETPRGGSLKRLLAEETEGLLARDWEGFSWIGK